MLACICGGIIELAILAVFSIFPLVGTWFYNVRQKKKCECACHPSHKEC